jgi:hypothetical protein
MFNMRRRQVITVLIGAAVAGPLAARAQVPGRRPLIAYLAGASSASAFASTAPSLLKGLRDLGYVEGRDFDITYRFADGHMERLPELADEVLRLKPDIILAPATRPALVAKQAAATSHRLPTAGEPGRARLGGEPQPARRQCHRTPKICRRSGRKDVDACNAIGARCRPHWHVGQCRQR